MRDKGEGGVKNLKKWVMSIMDGPFRELIKYLEECSNLKILKIDFEGEIYSDNWFDVDYLEYCPLGLLETEEIFKRFKFQNLVELHINGFDCDIENFSPQGFRDIFNMFHENLPKLRRLCFKLDNIDRLAPEYDQFFQEFASEKNIKIEITGTPVYYSRRYSQTKFKSFSVPEEKSEPPPTPVYEIISLLFFLNDGRHL